MAYICIDILLLVVYHTISGTTRPDQWDYVLVIVLNVFHEGIYPLKPDLKAIIILNNHTRNMVIAI